MRTGNNYSGARWTRAARKPTQRHIETQHANGIHSDCPRDGSCAWWGTEKCPVCAGVVELTPSGFLTCREHGSEHYRVKADV